MVANKKNMQSAGTIAFYDRIIATHPEIQRKGAANPYTSVNGNMFTMLSPSGVMALRLPENERKKFLEKFKAQLAEAHGTVLKEYVAVPNDLLGNTKVMKKYLEISYDYAKALKTKATKKR
jgi:TfoX/Sxy family transcriptional regulator of competence genes